MAVLPDLDREAVRHDLATQWSNDFSTIAITKADLQAAVNALDDYLNNNAAAINNALPAAAKAGLTAPQKGLLLATVALRRYWGGV